MSSNKELVTPSNEHLLGRVKWFNNKSGYGFITVTDGTRAGTDVFVHHSAVNVESQQYKYLVQGEYVEFDLIKTESDKHEWQASNVSGVKGGKLMCETRNELKAARNEYKATNTTTTVNTTPKQKSTSKPRQNTSNSTPTPASTPIPRQKRPTKAGDKQTGDKKEWTLVSGKGSERKPKKN